MVSLILHGLGAISVHGDVVGVRALIATLVAILLGIIAIGGVLVIRFGTNLAIPGWATYAIGLLAAILLQTVSLALVFVFITLNSRDRSTFIPKRDYEAYIAARHQYP